MYPPCGSQRQDFVYFVCYNICIHVPNWPFSSINLGRTTFTFSAIFDCVGPSKAPLLVWVQYACTTECSILLIQYTSSNKVSTKRARTRGQGIYISHHSTLSLSLFIFGRNSSCMALTCSYMPSFPNDMHTVSSIFLKSKKVDLRCQTANTVACCFACDLLKGREKATDGRRWITYTLQWDLSRTTRLLVLTPHCWSSCPSIPSGF